MMFENVGVIFCGGRQHGCDFRIDTNSTGISLAQLKERLEGITTLHSELCGGTPLFSIEEAPGIPGLSALVMRCDSCPVLEIVL